MSVSETIRLIRIIHSEIHQASFKQYGIPINLLDNWYKNKNIIALSESLSSENREKFWKLLRSLGVESIEQINRINSIIDVLNTKDLPVEIRTFLPRFSNMGEIIRSLCEDNYKMLLEWCDKNISEDEIITTQNLKEMDRYIFKEQKISYQPTQQSMKQSIQQSRQQYNGRTFNQIKICPQTQRPRATHANIPPTSVPPVYQSISIPGIRSFQELQNIYNQYH